MIGGNGPTCWNCGTYYVTKFIGCNHYCSECAKKLKKTLSELGGQGMDEAEATQ